MGSCDGTIRPTTAPAYSSLADHNGCPVEFDASATYEAGDKVELYGLAYECRSWPNSGWCSQDGYEPDGPNYKEAWIVLGFCEGTMAPTTSPNFSSLAEIGDGCPKEYDSSTVYESGDQVSVSVNDAKSVVYECKSWPNGAYCNSGDNFAPGTDNGNLGWTKKGFCDGTLSPTKAPIVYAPNEKCRWYNGTKAITIEPWSDAKRSTYVAGTRVRKGTNIYKSETIGVDSPESCQNECLITDAFRGFYLDEYVCACMYDFDGLPTPTPDGFEAITSGTGPIAQQADGSEGVTCYKYLPDEYLFEALATDGHCTDASGNYYSALISFGADSPQSCQNACLQSITDAFRGSFLDEDVCGCLYDAGNLPTTYPEGFYALDFSGTGPIAQADGDIDGTCYKYLPNSNN
eukprot:scaffold64115_cov42-Cyclotella_meneghiniana.AAC.1